MNTNTLLAGIVGFLLGGFVVSVAAQLEDGTAADGGSEMTISQRAADIVTTHEREITRLLQVVGQVEPVHGPFLGAHDPRF